MEFFDDFLRMSAQQRISYVRENGLSDAQRAELLSLNRVIAQLMREDAYWHERMRGELKKLEALTRKHDGNLPW